MTPIVDASAVICAAFYRGGETTVDVFARELEAVGRGFRRRPELALDAPGPTWRHERYPDYKAGRPPKPDGLEAYVARCLAWAAGEGYACWWAPGYEADDVLATLAAGRAPAEVAIVSGDKDLLQLASDRVTVWWRAEQRDPVDVLGVPADQVVALLALAGDPGDGVPGLPGVGPVNAVAALERAGGDLDEVRLNARAELGPKAVRRAFREDGAVEALALWLDLVTLRADAPVVGWTPPADNDCDDADPAPSESAEPAPSVAKLDDCDGVNDEGPVPEALVLGGQGPYRGATCRAIRRMGSAADHGVHVWLEVAEGPDAGCRIRVPVANLDAVGRRVAAQAPHMLDETKESA